LTRLRADGELPDALWLFLHDVGVDVIGDIDDELMTLLDRLSGRYLNELKVKGMTVDTP
jgi:hypothetical protein